MKSSDRFSFIQVSVENYLIRTPIYYRSLRNAEDAVFELRSYDVHFQVERVNSRWWKLTPVKNVANTPFVIVQDKGK